MLARYEIKREIGRGGVGVVYEAWDTVSGRTVALKTVQLPPAGTDADRAQLEEELLTEAAIASELAHPHIVEVLDSGRDPDTGTLYVAFEYVDGAPLEDIVTPATPIPWPQALRIAERLSGALDHAHALGILHRDVKPSNVMLLPDGEPKVLDFGIAAIAETGGALASRGRHVGTPLYLSPEQALGRPVDVRSDVFQLGAVLYFLLTGRAPFLAGTIRAILIRVVQEDPLPPSRFAVGLPGDVDDIVRRAMAKNPAERYPDARQLAEDIEDVLAGRPARHLARWAPPAAAQTNPFSPVDPETAITELEEELRSGAGTVNPRAADLSVLTDHGLRGIWRAYGRVSRVAVVFAVAAITGAAVGFVPWRAPSEPTAAGVEAAIVRVPSSGQAEPMRNAMVSAASLAAEPIRSSAPAPDLVAESVPAPVRKAPALHLPPAVAPAPATPHPSRLALDFEHGLRSGRLRLWIDDTLRLDANLGSQARRKALRIRSRKGILDEVLEVEPGAHDLRLEVTWEGNTRTQRTQATFLPGESRRLSARVGGLLKKSLSMQWRYTDARASK